MAELRFAQWLAEDNQRTGAKVGLYPPSYTLSQYPNAYYTPLAADYVTYHDIEKKNPSPTVPPQNKSFVAISPDDKGNIKRQKQYP